MSTRLNEEAGFTLVELMVSVMILTVGLLALVGTLDSARALTDVSERKENVAHIAQRELDRILALPYSQVAMATPLPTRSTNPDDPDYYLTTATPATFQWNRDDATKLEDLVSGGSLAASTTWTSGRLGGTFHRYVTSVDDADCRPAGSCATGAYRRVTVAVTVNGGKLRRPTIVSGLVVDPNDGPTASPGTAITECVNASGQLEVCDSPGAGAYTAWHLYDTQAGSLYSDVRQPVTANHGTHATVASTGTCTAGDSSGCPRPDLMGTTAPPAAPAYPLFNYSYLDQPLLRGTYGGGRVLARESTTCTGTPSADNTMGQMWVSPPLASAKTLTGRGGLSLWTQTLGGAAAGGTLCLEVYDVPGNVSNLTATGTLPTPLGRTSYTFESWPASMSPVNFAFEYGSGAPVDAGRRVGVRLWLSSSSSADKVAILYDDHDNQSIVQLNEEGP